MLEENYKIEGQSNDSSGSPHHTVEPIGMLTPLWGFAQQGSWHLKLLPAWLQLLEPWTPGSVQVFFFFFHNLLGSLAQGRLFSSVSDFTLCHLWAHHLQLESIKLSGDKVLFYNYCWNIFFLFKKNFFCNFKESSAICKVNNLQTSTLKVPGGSSAAN